MAHSLLSVLTPTFNRADSFLPQCLLSVQSQHEIGFEHEHIIVDDGSNDGTEEVVAEWRKKDNRIKYIQTKKNSGPAAALNAAFAIAKGSLIVPLDDDDFLPLQSLQMRFDFFQDHPEVDWAFGYSFQVDDHNAIIEGMYERIPVFEEDPKRLFEELMKLNTISNGAVTIRLECISKIGGWDPAVASQDWDLWLKLAYGGHSHALMKNYLSFYRIHNHRLTTSQSVDGTWERDRAYFQKKYPGI
jgi:teichuronic acid biosynthesis glycosyltransferase TuaG